MLKNLKNHFHVTLISTFKTNDKTKTHNIAHSK